MGDPLPYPIEDIIRNPKCLMWCEASNLGFSNQIKNVCWSPPQDGSLKWNVNASFNPLLNRSTIGGGLRNFKGEFINLFSMRTPPMEINNVEINAIFRAPQITANSPSHINSKNLIIESDLLNAVKECSLHFYQPSNSKLESRCICAHKTRSS